ncbi:MAG: glycosyltransferase family 4 protein [Chloroflexi bacterium]|nr:glycosyltransferase family 4 protein [Chloroflexota bacterium]
MKIHGTLRSPIRVLIASGIFHPDIGGPATYLHSLLPALQERGYAFHVLTYGDAPSDGYGYPVERISFKHGMLRRRRLYARRYAELAAQSDLIYVNALGLPRPRVAKPLVLKIVGDYAWERALHRRWIAPDTDLDAFQKRLDLPHVEWFKARRAREAREADKIIVPSEHLRRLVIGWRVPPERVQVIYNALEPNLSAPAQTQAQARVALGWQPEGRYLLYVGRLIALKGVQYLIQALDSLPEVTLVVAGEGDYLPRLRALAERCNVAARVRFLGKVPHAQVPLLMRAADYLALYSSTEGLSHTLLEALRVGTPVIASARGGNLEVVRHGVNGLLVPHPDLSALRSALGYAFSDGVRDALAAGSAVGMARFSWQTLLDQTDAALRALLERR